MSLVGSVSLTDQKNSLYLGSVNIDNLNLNPNELLYSDDGINISGLSIGNGLQKVLNELKTVGNPDIQLTSNSIFVNDGEKSIQTAINDSSQADCLYISSGSYGEYVNIDNKYNIALCGPSLGNSTICEILDGLNITNTSELIRMNNLTVKVSTVGRVSNIIPIGRCIFNNVVFSGTSGLNHTINIGSGTTKYMTFYGCEFDNYCVINISNTLTAPIYFINCNFGGATINYNNLSPLLVILNNCSGLLSYPSSLQATMIGMCVLTTGNANLNTTTINGSSYPPQSSNVSVLSQADNRIVTCTATTDIFQGESQLLWDGNNLQLYNGNHINIGRGNNSNHTNLSIGVNSGIAITTGTNNTNIGHLSGQSLTTGSDNVIIGSSVSVLALSGKNVAIGSGVCKVSNNSSDSRSVAIGFNASALGTGHTVSIGNDAYSSGRSVALGSECGRSNMTGTYNVLMGSSCGVALTSGASNCLIGSNNCQNLTSGTQNTIIGISAGSGQSTHSNNTIIGYFSNASDGTNHYTNCSVLGANIRNGVISGNNQVQLGDSSTTVYSYATATRSDARDKADITNSNLGLEFISKLQPRKWRWDYREDYKIEMIDENQNITTIELDKDGSKKRNRFHYGIIAQELKETMNEMSIDFGGYQDHSFNGGADRQTINYIEFIAPLIKSIQELNEKVKNLELQISQLQK
jgi:hypothetical protein